MNDFIITDGVLKKYCGNEEKVTIPEGVSIIAMHAFMGSAAKEIIFSEGVEIIEGYACVNMLNLHRVTFPSSLREIGYRAFGNCKHLATDDLIIPEKTDVQPTSFNGCCRRSVREVECNVCFIRDSETTEEHFYVDVFDDDKLADVVAEYIATYISDNGTFDDIIEDAMGSCDTAFCEDGTIDIYAIGADLYSAAKEAVEASDIGVMVISASTDEWPMPIEIDIKLILKSRIENRAECETWAVDVGGQVEAIITSFVEEGKWNVGFKTSDDVIKDASCFSNIHFDGEWKDGEDVITPVLWFGAHDTPMKRWSIDKNILPAEYEFWFLEDGYEAMYRIVPDSSGYFDIWYFAECGREFADISDIMKSCPVNFQESDSPEEIKQKIDHFYIGLFLDKKGL